MSLLVDCARRFCENLVGQWIGSLCWMVAAFVFAGCTLQPGLAGPGPARPLPPPTLPNGVAAGDVDQTGAVLWVRSTVTGPITFTVGTEHANATQQIQMNVLDPAAPITATLADLTSNTQYQYQVTNAAGETASGRFRTAAPVGVYTGLRFGVGGDWRGDLAPYPAMANAPGRDLDFFLALGDLVYADIPSAVVPLGPAHILAEFRRKFEEVYATHHDWNTWADLRASTALFVTIDDHEVRDNFAGGAEADRDRRFSETQGRINDTEIYENAMQALHEYHPMRREVYGDTGDDRMDGEIRLYRYRTFGSDAALIVLDARSFRDLPLARPDRHDPDDVARFRQQTFRADRTMLGAQQLADLKRDLLDAQARGVTWIFVAVPEPVQNRGLISAHDRFEGYAAERTDLLRFVEENGICNAVFVAADIHGTLVNNLTYRTTPESPNHPIQAFEITVSPAAFNPPLGPVVLQDGLDQGYVTEEEAEVYRSLPVRNDPDGTVDDRDDWVKAKIDEELLATGYDPLGLEGSPIDAELRQGDYVATEYYGWTEFEIDAESQALTVTSYGIMPYGRATLADNLEQVLSRQPEIVSQFVVHPSDCS